MNSDRETPAAASIAAELRRLEASGALDAALALAQAATDDLTGKLWQARLLAKLGRAREARTLLASPEPVESWPEQAVAEALALLDVRPLFGSWIRIAHERVRADPLLTSSAGGLRAIYNRLARIGSFFILGQEERALATDMWARVQPKQVLPFVTNERRARNVAVFLASRAEGEVDGAIAKGVARLFPDSEAAWTAHMIEQHDKGRASDLELARFGAGLALGAGELGRVCSRLLERKAFAALGELVSRRSGAVARAFDTVADAQIAAGAPWLAEQDGAVLQAHALGGATARSLPRAALALGNRALALARSTAALTGTPGQCVDTAKRLAGEGFRMEGAQLLQPVREQSEAAAFRWAKLSGGGPRERRSLGPWQAAHTAFPSRRIRNAYAAAIAEEALDYGEAEALLVRSIEEAPDELDAWRRLASIRAVSGDPAAEANLLDRMTVQFPNNDWVRTQQMRARFAAGDLEAAVSAIAGSGDEAGAHQARLEAELHLMRGDNALASEAWARVAEERDTAADHYKHVVALFQEDRFTDAVAALQRLSVRFPGFWRFHLKLAQAHERAGAYGLALDSYARALAIEPMTIDPSAGIGRCLVYLGRHDDCATWLGRLDDRRIDAGWVHSLRAFNLAMAGQAAEAQAALEPLRRLAADFLVDRAAARAADAAAVWLKGGFVHHPHPEAAAHSEAFATGLDRIAAAETVALVGNAPGLLGGGRGAAIDAADCVIRLNDFQTEGFEADVGARTDLWYSAAARTARPRTGVARELPTWLYQDRPYELPDLAGFSQLRLRRTLALPQACFLPPDIHLLSSRLIYSWPTSGLRLIGLILLLGGRAPTLYGFDFFKAERMHYYEADNRNLHLGEFHAIAFERDFVTRVLVEGGHVRLGD